MGGGEVVLIVVGLAVEGGGGEVSVEVLILVGLVKGLDCLSRWVWLRESIREEKVYEVLVGRRGLGGFEELAEFVELLELAESVEPVEYGLDGEVLGLVISTWADFVLLGLDY